MGPLSKTWLEMRRWGAAICAQMGHDLLAGDFAVLFPGYGRWLASALQAAATERCRSTVR